MLLVAHWVLNMQILFTQGVVSSLNRNVSLKSEDGQAISTKSHQTDTTISKVTLVAH